MKKKEINYRRMFAGVAIISVFACSIAWITPSPFLPEEVKAKETGTALTPASAVAPVAAVSEEVQLVQLLEKDGLVDEIKGFVVEKNQNVLFINGKQVSDNVAGKYLSTIKKENMRVQVYPFMERVKQHPNEGLLLVLFPVSLSSPCVNSKPKQPGC